MTAVLPLVTVVPLPLVVSISLFSLFNSFCVTVVAPVDVLTVVIIASPLGLVSVSITLLPSVTNVTFLPSLYSYSSCTPTMLPASFLVVEDSRPSLEILISRVPPASRSNESVCSPFATTRVPEAVLIAVPDVPNCSVTSTELSAADTLVVSIFAPLPTPVVTVLTTSPFALVSIEVALLPSFTVILVWPAPNVSFEVETEFPNESIVVSSSKRTTLPALVTAFKDPSAWVV